MYKIYTIFALLFSLFLFAANPTGSTVKVKLTNNCGKSVSIRIMLENNGLQASLANGESKEYALRLDSKIDVNGKEAHKVSAGDEGKEIKLCP